MFTAELHTTVKKQVTEKLTGKCLNSNGGCKHLSPPDRARYPSEHSKLQNVGFY
jgi:hypothetical protein